MRWVPINVKEDNIDFCMASAQKGLMAMTGVFFVIGKRSADEKILKTEDKKQIFLELKRCNGFDVVEDGLTCESFEEQKNNMENWLSGKAKQKMKSIYEVGCGSGVNLYLFEKLKNIKCIGGCDYSEPLIKIAKKVLDTEDLQCKEAEKISTRPIYDVVIADSVFQYFQSPEYGMSVLKKMWDKAKKIIVITELHDQSMKEQYLNYRRQCVENYDERYRGWIKHFTQKKCSWNLQSA